MKKATYQFRHLILQEFLCALYIVITRSIDSYKETPQFKICEPTILGVRKFVRETENELFQKLFANLKSMNKQHSSNIQQSFNKHSFNRYFKNYVSAPEEMIEAEILTFTDTQKCREFVKHADEMKNVLDSSEFSAIRIVDVFDIEFLKTILSLNERGTKRPITMLLSMKDEFEPQTLIKLVKLIINKEKFKTLFIFEDTLLKEPEKIQCTNDRLTLVFYSNTCLLYTSPSPRDS